MHRGHGRNFGSASSSHTPYNASQAAAAAQALTSTLANPYTQQYSTAHSGQHNVLSQGYVSSHYAQAYAQAAPSAPLLTAQGYSLSSAYHASPYPFPGGPSTGSNAIPFQQRGRGGSQHNVSRFIPQNHGQWYEPGGFRCNYHQCTFAGSKKSVEIHMMDRHLIYPPGWEKRRQKSDWDADPSLNNGKPIPIQGTSVILDTPEAIDAWIAERRKRWPTAGRVEDKTKKLQDAIARGEINADDPSMRGHKRRRTDDGHGDRGTRGRGQPRGRGSQRGRQQAGPPTARVPHALPARPVEAAKPQAAPVVVGYDTDSEESSSSDSDMDPEKDAVSSKAPPSGKSLVEGDQESTLLLETAGTVDEPVPASTKTSDASNVPSKEIEIAPAVRRRPAQPKRPLANTFASRPSLLRNLLLPEIRMTVSNLSQAIRFLVDNDFLEGVELKPGDIENKPIEVLKEGDDNSEQS